MGHDPSDLHAHLFEKYLKSLQTPSTEQGVGDKTDPLPASVW